MTLALGVGLRLMLSVGLVLAEGEGEGEATAVALVACGAVGRRQRSSSSSVDSGAMAALDCLLIAGLAVNHAGKAQQWLPVELGALGPGCAGR